MSSAFSIGFAQRVSTPLPASFGASVDKIASGFTGVGSSGGASASDGDLLDISSAGLRTTVIRSAQLARRSHLRFNYAENVQALGGTAGTTTSATDKYLLNMNGIGLIESPRAILPSGDLEDQLLNEKINIALKKADIRLEKDEKLSFTVNENGYIKVGGDFSDEKKLAIQNALNNGDLGKDLVISQARHLNTVDAENKSTRHASLTNRIFTDATLEKNFGLSLSDFEESAWDLETEDWEGGLPFRCTAEGQEELAGEIYLDSYSLFDGIDRFISNEEKIDSFELEMTYFNGELVRRDDDHPETLPGIFNDRHDSFESLGKIVGLDVEVDNIDDFAIKLEEINARETDALTAIITELLGSSGLASETRKITFAEGEDGRIVIEGNIRADLKAKLERNVNRDEKLVERIKDHKAKLEIFNALAGKEEDENGNLKITANQQFDLGGEDLEAARTQLLKSYLSENGVAMDEIRHRVDEEGKDVLYLSGEDGVEKDSGGMQTLFAEFWDLEDELIKRAVSDETSGGVLKAPKSIGVGNEAKEPEETRSLLAMKRGELSEAFDEGEPDFSTWADGLRKTVAEKIKQYNEEIAQFDDTMRITDYSIRIDDRGNMVIENVKTKGGDAKKTLQAQQFLNTTAASLQEDFADALFSHHDDEHGDVLEYKHFMTISSRMGKDPLILSPEADKAALAEMGQLASEISADFSKYFQASGIRDSFEISWMPEQGLSFSGLAAGSVAGRQVTKLLLAMNERLFSDDPLNDTLFGNDIPVELDATMEKLLALDYAHGKLHDPALKKVGMSFSINA